MTSIASAISYAAPTPRTRVARSVIVGRVLSGIITVLLIADGVYKLIPPNQQMIDGAAQLGYSLASMVPIGLTLLTCVLLYAIPRTSVFGALLLTGYLGGAIATHVRVGNPTFTHVLFPTYVALFVWGGLYLRNPRLRALVKG